MKELLIYHNVESRTTFLIIDGKLYGEGCRSISFSHEGGENAEITLCIDPLNFKENQEMLDMLKEKGFHLDMG